MCASLIDLVLLFFKNFTGGDGHSITFSAAGEMDTNCATAVTKKYLCSTNDKFGPGVGELHRLCSLCI